MYITAEPPAYTNSEDSKATASKYATVEVEQPAPISVKGIMDQCRF